MYPDCTVFLFPLFQTRIPLCKDNQAFQNSSPADFEGIGIGWKLQEVFL